MTKLFLSLLVTFALTLTAYAGTPGDGTILKVKTDQSTISWTGKKVTGKHHGIVNIKEGSLSLNDKGVLTGGNFIIDMPTITVLDLEGNGKANLEKHLKSDDFFGVETFPTASLNVKNAKATGNNTYDVTADLTIKGITHEITFPASVSVEGKEATAKAEIKIDRSLFDVRYGSGKFFENLGDKTIYDEFELQVTLVAAR